MSADPCQRLRDALEHAIQLRDDYVESEGDLLDQGVPIESIKHEEKILDQIVASANRSLLFCRHTQFKCQPPHVSLTPQDRRILDVANADPSAASGYQNPQRPILTPIGRPNL